MRLSPFAAVVAACVLTLTGCGDDGSDPKSSNDATSSAGDKQGKDERPDLGPVDVCTDLDATEVGEVLGIKAKRGKISKNNSCTFADPRSPSGRSVAFNQVSVEAAGGADAVKEALDTAVENGSEELTDLGDAAVVSVAPGAVSTVSATGAILVGDSLVQVSPSPVADVPEAVLRDQVVALLELVEDAL